MRITDIRRGKDGAEKYHLYVDGNYLLTVHEQVYYENHLAVGQTVTGQDLDSLQQQSQFIWAKSLALQHLSRRSMSAKQLKDKLKEAITNPEEQTIYISHGDCEEEARYLADLIAKEVPVKGFVFNHVGPVIGAHTGAGVIALFCVGTQR